MQSGRKPSTQELESDLSALVQRAALLYAYVSERYNNNATDIGHDSAARRANKTLVKIRKAMGFTYPSRAALQIR